MEETRDVALDLRGFNLTISTNDYIIKNNGNLTIMDSKYTDDLEEAQANYERTQALYDAEYEQELEEYNNLVTTTNQSYREVYENKLNAEIDEENDRKQAQANYETALEEYNQQMVKYNEDLAKYKQYLSKFTMPNMDGIVDYFDYNNYENGTWLNTLSDGNEMTIYGNPELTNEGVHINRQSGDNYATLSVDNAENLIVYMVGKSLSHGRLFEIPAVIPNTNAKVPIVDTVDGKIVVSTWGSSYDKYTSYNLLLLLLYLPLNLETMYIIELAELSIGNVA